MKFPLVPRKKPRPAPPQNLSPLEIWTRRALGVLKYIRKHPTRTYLAATLAAGTVTTCVPQTVSTTLDGHMASQNLPALSPYFSTANTRVYDRGNFLQVPHSTFLATAATAETFSEKPISTLIALSVFNFNSVIRQLLPGAADAYALGTPQDHATRRCFIRPPRRTSIDKMINTFTGLNIEEYRVNGDRQRLGDIFYVYVMAHEARHCDQFGERQLGLLHETDSDTYALRVLRHIYGETPGDIAEIEGLLKNLRIISAVIHGDSGHASDRAFDRPQHTVMQALDDQTHYIRAAALLREIVRMNKDVFDDAAQDYEPHARYYHAAKALLQDPAGRNPDLRRAVNAYIAAIDDLDARTDETLVPALPAGAGLETARLTSPYTPAPDRVLPPPLPRTTS